MCTDHMFANDILVTCDILPIDVMHLRGAKGVMRTHDEETKDYFAHTNVKVRLAYKGSTQEKNFLRCGV